MNETKKISLEEAKSEIKRISQEARECREFTRPEAFDQVLDILENVEMPSEDEMAVIWLIREWDWDCFYDKRNGWYVRTKGHYFSPTNEARKLGWGG